MPSFSNVFVNSLSRTGMIFRLLRARARHSALRVGIGDLPGFYAALDDAGIGYVVLRWAGEVPHGPDEEAGYARDIDHLIADGAFDGLFRTCLAFPGSIKCEFYTVRGERGGSYRRMPYYMPEMARQIVERRVRHARGFFVPSPRDAYLSFLYHVVYHKGLKAGIETGFDINATPAGTRRYADEILRLADAADMAVPQPFTLRGIHDHLRGFGWNMATDLLLRWPDQSPVILALTGYEKARLAPEMAAAANLTVFVLREDCVGEEAERLVREMIATRFTILDELPLEGTALDRVVLQTRGGKWMEKGRARPVLPTRALICRDAAVPGPLPVAMSPAKLKARYPHLRNTDVLIKRVIRDEVSKLDGVPKGATVLHATDNPLETVETLRAIYGDEMAARLSRLTSRDHT